MNRVRRSIPALYLFAVSSMPAFATDYPASRVEAELVDARHSVQVDLAGIKGGELRIVQYAGQTIWIYRRSEADIEYLHSEQQEHLSNPNSEGFLNVVEDQFWNSASEVWVRLLMVSQPKIERERFRSLTEQYLVVAGHGPLGCSLKQAPIEMRPFPNAPFFDVCAGTWFDVAGRLLKSEWEAPRVRAKELTRANLLIPPHYFSAPAKLVIGLHPSESIPKVDLDEIRARVYERLDPASKLAYAASFNDIEEVRRGLKSGAHRQTTQRSPNPLDGAIAGGSMEIIQLILAHGIRPTTNSYEIAELVERPEVTKVLRQSEKYSASDLTLRVTARPGDRTRPRKSVIPA